MATTPIPARLATRLKSPFVLLLIAILAAGAVAWLAHYYLRQTEAAMKADLAARDKRGSAATVTVAVPRIDAPAGTVLDTQTFVARPVEQDLVYPDTVLVEDFAAMQGQKLARPVLRGRPLRLADVVAPEVRDVASILPVGRRALTIEIDNVNSIAHALRPNNRVDIFLLHKGAPSDTGNDADQEQATLYMQDMVVLGTGTDFHDVSRTRGLDTEEMARPGDVPGAQKEYDTVTLLVTPEQAARLMIGQKLGAFRVALRGGDDRDPVRLATLRAGAVFPSGRRRDAGVEFIVGGNGTDKLVSQLPVAPSQEALLRAAGAPSSAPAPAAATAAEPPRTVTITVPATRANRPIPALN
jgi:pilus assembly protein CpaB